MIAIEYRGYGGYAENKLVDLPAPAANGSGYFRDRTCMNRGLQSALAVLKADMFVIAANSGAALHLTTLGEMRADEINRVLRRVRAHLLRGASGKDLAVTFEAPQRIEQRASGLQEAAAMMEATQP
jgi:hypothetical protein